MKEKKTRKTFVLFALVLTFMLGLVGTSLFAFAESSGAETISVQNLITADSGATVTSVAEVEAYRLDNAKLTYEWGFFDWNGGYRFSNVASEKEYVKGIKIPLSNNNEEYKIHGTFNGAFEMDYVFGSKLSVNGDVFFIFKDLSGKELFRVGRVTTNANKWGAEQAYVRYTENDNVRFSSEYMESGAIGTYYPWEKDENIGKADPDTINTDYNVCGGGQYFLPGQYYNSNEVTVESYGTNYDVKNITGTISVSYGDKGNSRTPVSSGLTESSTLFINVTSKDGVRSIGQIDCSDDKNSVIKDAIEKGFTVSIAGGAREAEKHGADVIVSKINGVSLSVDNIDIVEEIGVVYPTEFEIDSEKYIDTIIGEDLRSFETVNRKKIGGNANWTTLSEKTVVQATDFDKNKVGLQKITVSGNEYNVFVAPKVTGFDLLDENDYKYTTLESYDSTWSGLAGQGHYINKGIEFPFDDATKPDSYYLPGTFVGGFDTEYAFSSRGNGSNDGTKFVFENLSGEELFTVERYHVWGEVRQGGSVKVTKGGTELFKEEAMIYPSKYLTDDYQAAKPDGCVQDAVAQRPGNIRVDVSDSSVTVSVTKIVNYNDFAVLGAEGSQSFTINVDKARDIATIISAMNTGYKVKVERGAAGRQNVLIIGINGKKLTDQAVTYRALSADKFEYDGDKNGSGDTLYIARRGTLEPVTVTGKVAVAGVSATGEWKLPYSAKGTVKATDGSVVSTDTAGNQTVNMTAVFFAREFVQSVTLVVEESQKLVYQTNYGTNGGTALDDLYFSQNDPIGDLATPSRTGGWTFEGWFASSDLSGNALTTAPAYSAEGGTSNDTVTLYAKWGDYEKPVVALKSGVNSLTVSVKADGGSVSFSKADVTAEDRAWGVISADGISVEIKAPNASDFVDISAFVFDDALYGNYTVKYTATDGSNNDSEPVERIIRYVPQLPSITLSGDRISDGYVNHRIDLPVGTSSSAVTVSVVAGGKAVNVVDNGFTPTQSGTYTVAYYTKDEYGSETVETFDIEIKADGEKPVITVDFDIETGTVGAEISLPSATATDNADGSVSVSVSVTFGDKEITVENGKFTPSEAGIYTVTYTATDASGNTAIVSREILVSAASGGKKGSGCKNAAVGEVAIGTIVLIAASLTLLIAKRKIV